MLKQEHISYWRESLQSTLLQALAIPVIDAVDSIYLLDSEEATASLDTQTEGERILKQFLHCYFCNQCLQKLLKANNTDATLAKYIDEMSDEQILVFKLIL
jgi:hypothetical protein